MSSFASRTMQKLFAARLLLDRLGDADQQDELIQHSFKAAHVDAVLFHLQGALQSLLYEIAETARMPAGQWHSLEDLHQAAEDNERFLPQLNVLLELQNDSFSWFSQFQKRYQACWLPDVQPGADSKGVKTVDSNSLIALSEDSISDQQQLQLWLDSMQALVRDLRQTMQEY